ncbi:MAG: hypothetical protein ACLGIG_00195 [Actinomycetes bacterium]
MSRTVPALAAAVAIGVLASRPIRARVSALVRRRRDRLPRGVETYPAPVVDRRAGAAAEQLPRRAETPAEITSEFYAGRDPA